MKTTWHSGRSLSKNPDALQKENDAFRIAPYVVLPHSDIVRHASNFYPHIGAGLKFKSLIVQAQPSFGPFDPGIYNIIFT